MAEATLEDEHAVDVEAVAEQIETLLDQIAAAGPVAAERAEALVRTLMSLYGDGLARILDHLDPADTGVRQALVGDPVVAGLLSLHDLHPVGVRERVEDALDDVRPYLGTHGGDVSLLGIDDGVARLRLEGSCDGCPSSQVTLEHAVEAAIYAAAPEVADIEVEGATPPPAQDGALIPLESLRSRPPEYLQCPTEIAQ